MAMLQELAGNSAEVGNDENTGDGDDKALTELQTLFNALKKTEAKMQVMNGTSEDTAKAEWIKRWWKKFKYGFGSKIHMIVRKYWC